MFYSLKNKLIHQENGRRLDETSHEWDAPGQFCMVYLWCAWYGTLTVNYEYSVVFG